MGNCVAPLLSSGSAAQRITAGFGHVLPSLAAKATVGGTSCIGASAKGTVADAAQRSIGSPMAGSAPSASVASGDPASSAPGPGHLPADLASLGLVRTAALDWQSKLSGAWAC